MKRIIPMLAALICSVTAGLAQTRTINGKVTDPADSTPVIGAVVIIKGDTGTTLTGTTTDADGKYSADITAAAKTVEIQCLGYKTASVAINGRTTINVSLEQESQMIEETVVTALGINRAAKSLQRSRRERRKNKDMVKLYERIVKFKEDQNNRRTINLLRQLLGQQRKEEEYLRSNRTYKKRMDG